MRKKDQPVVVVNFINYGTGTSRLCGGYWNGLKSGGVYRPERVSRKVVRWGSWDLNYWFEAGFGVSWKHAASTARRMLQHSLKVPATITVE